MLDDREALHNILLQQIGMALGMCQSDMDEGYMTNEDNVYPHLRDANLFAANYDYDKARMHLQTALSAYQAMIRYGDYVDCEGYEDLESEIHDAIGSVIECIHNDDRLSIYI
jgi:hypothetical protein